MMPWNWNAWRVVSLMVPFANWVARRSVSSHWCGVATPPASNLGHYHIGYDEFWFVMEGNIDVQIEGVPLVQASAGDIILAAQGHWHRASFGGPIGQMGTRVAINPYPAGLHNYTMESGGRQ